MKPFLDRLAIYLAVLIMGGIGCAALVTTILYLADSPHLWVKIVGGTGLLFVCAALLACIDLGGPKTRRK